MQMSIRAIRDSALHRAPLSGIDLYMTAVSLKKERWTLTLDRQVKRTILEEARKRKVRPARVLEDLVRERFDPFGHADVDDPVAYVRALRRESREMTDEDFLTDLKRWERAKPTKTWVWGCHG